MCRRYAGTQSAPSTYTVVAGDTVSSIAARYGLATASVLALNGLGWKARVSLRDGLKLAYDDFCSSEQVASR